MRSRRGLIHVHSDYSYDCNVPLARIRDLARGRGMGFVLQTEHSNRLTAEEFRDYKRDSVALSDEDFRLVPGIEYASADNRIHVLTFGIDEFWEDLRLFPTDRALDLLDRVRKRGGLSILAHPERADALANLPEGFLAGLDGIEIWNRKTDKLGPSPGAIDLLARCRLGADRKIATAGLDLHRESDYLPVGLELSGSCSDDRDLIGRVREGGFRVFAGPWRWNAAEAGSVARAVALASRGAVRSARRWKARLRGARDAAWRGRS